MDLSAAYDSIDRDLLFAKLKHRGMSDHSINTLKHPVPKHHMHCEDSVTSRVDLLTSVCG
jgi:hypothetical protein